MTPPTTATPLDVLAAELWDATLAAEPPFGTAVGDHRVDALMPDHSPAGLAATRARFASIGTTLAALPPAEGEDPVTRSALRDAVDERLAVIDCGLLAWNVDTLDGIPVQVLNLADYQPAATPADRTALLARWRAIGRFVDDHAANLRRSLSGGLVACSAPVDRVTDILAGVLAQPDAEWPLMQPARSDGAPDGPGPATAGGPTISDRERFAADVEAVIRDVIRPSFARLHDLLQSEIRPAARPPERPGLCHVPGGEAAYGRLIRVHTSLEVAPDELHRIGLAEIERIDAETEALAARVLGSRDRAAAVAALRADPALHFATREEVYETAATSLARATEAIPAWFGRLPQAPCVVVRMAAHEEEHSTLAFYRSPAQDGSRPGQYYLNTSHPETRPRYEAEALAFHESIPGHHLQGAIAQELPGLPAFRRHLGPNAFFEGWGLYTERLADEMGLYTGDLDRIGVLSYDAWRASRLVVDTGLHALGWTRSKAIEFMLEHTVLAENNIANEVDRYIVLPGQALAYKTGQLELLRLRADAERRLGAAFDIRAFHDTLLGSGAVALGTLRTIVEDWIERAEAGA